MTEIKINSTLCYIKNDKCFLMLYRNKKENDPCEGKWVGIGGKFEPGENARQCLLREVREETGLILTEYEFHGIIHFVSDTWPDEDMYLFSASGYSGNADFPYYADPDRNWQGVEKQQDFVCSEGDLYWIPQEKILSLNLWEGDRYFLSPLIGGKKKISMTCRYEGHKCVEVKDEEIYD